MISKVYLFTREHLVGTTLKRVPQLKLKPPVSILKLYTDTVIDNQECLILN